MVYLGNMDEKKTVNYDYSYFNGSDDKDNTKIFCLKLFFV